MCDVVVTGNIQSLVVHGTSLMFSRSGRLWLKDRGVREQLMTTPGLPVENWQALLIDEVGNLWVRSNTKLFERCGTCTGFSDRSLGVEHNSDPHLAMDGRGDIFVSTLSGAVAFTQQHRRVLSTGHGASDDAVGPLLVDSQRNLWLGMSGGGLLRRLGQGEWSGWRREDGLLNNSVWAIRRTRDGAVWVGTSAGLTIFDSDGRHGRSITTRTGLPSDRVLAIQPAPTSDVFVGTDPGGLAQLSKSGKFLRSYTGDAGLHGRISALVIDRIDRLWTVGSGGVFRSQPLTHPGEHVCFDRITIPSTTAEAIFRDILVAEDGAVWVAGSQGLSRFSRGRWETFTNQNGLAADDLDVIAERRGVVWVAYRDALGISRFKQSGDQLEGQSFTKENGLSSDVIYALGFDPRGELWATSDRGADVLVGPKWTHFDSRDGLIWDDTNSHALDTEDEDAVWIGTSEGMSRFAPARAGRSSQRSPTVITEAHSGKRKWSLDKEPTLPYKQREIGFRFANLDLASPPSNFRYRLSGYRREWVETQGHSVQFEALPAGRYLFEVEALTSDATWSSPSQFRFLVLSPWWQKWYSILGGTCFGLLSILGCWRARVKSLLRQKRHLQQLVAQQTNELRDNYDQLAAIAYLDQLTSLPNRRKFSDEVRERSAAGPHLVLLLLDLDRFKAINDTHGHDAGDAVLIATAGRLRSAVQPKGFVARLGGDEFAILLNAREFSAQELKSVCKQILGQCSGSVAFRGQELQIGCSIGVALSGPRLQAEDALYKAADLALYEVKRGGRNGFHIYTPGLTYSNPRFIKHCDEHVGVPGRP